MHRDRLKTHGSLELPPRPTPKRLLPCTVEGCEKLQAARGYCDTHYKRFLTHHDVTELHYHRKPVEEKVTKWGYRKLKRPEHPNADSAGFVYEHRIVMGKILGRPLRPEETVHHLNGDRKDNRPENLELWLDHHASGQRVSDIVAWAREVIATYGAFVDSSVQGAKGDT